MKLPFKIVNFSRRCETETKGYIFSEPQCILCVLVLSSHARSLACRRHELIGNNQWTIVEPFQAERKGQFTHSMPGNHTDSYPVAT